MNNRVEHCFFELLQAGLWDRKADPTSFEGEVDWKSILSMAQKQTVVGLVAEGIYSLPESLRPPKDTQYRLHLFLVRQSQSHALLNKVLKEVVTLFNENGIPHVLLKGQGLAQIYPHPERRGCGDIDLYVGIAYYEKACQLIRTFGEATDDKEIESVKHFHCHRSGVTIEIHRLAESQYNWWLDRRFQQWTKQYLDQGIPGRRWLLDGCEVILPPVQFDALYILNHIAHHFISVGVGLRQICDWVRFLEVYSRQIDHSILRKDLKRLGMWNFWQVFGGIAVRYLGFPAEQFPCYCPGSFSKSEKVWEWISGVGNFGKYSSIYTHSRPSAYIGGKLFSFSYQMSSKVRMFRIFPKETADFVCWYVVQGIGNVLRHK